MINGWLKDERLLRKHELMTLGFLRANVNIKKRFPILSNNANDTYLALSKSTLPFEFESEFKIFANQNEGTAYIGARSLYNDSHFTAQTYYFAVAINGRLSRKFHFDYALPTNTQRSRQPVFQLQYAGELSRRLLALDLEYKHLDCGLSEPRISYFPMTLGLLINMIFIEFPDENNKKIIQLSEWRNNVVRRDEMKFIAPYIAACHNYLVNKKNDHLFTNDFCYGG
ncbi:MAG: hypothetical protein ACHQQQ_03405 [Bacteroidota bacterium]